MSCLKFRSPELSTIQGLIAKFIIHNLWKDFYLFQKYFLIMNFHCQYMHLMNKKSWIFDVNCMHQIISQIVRKVIIKLIMWYFEYYSRGKTFILNLTIQIKKLIFLHSLFFSFSPQVGGNDHNKSPPFFSTQA